MHLSIPPPPRNEGGGGGCTGIVYPRDKTVHVKNKHKGRKLDLAGISKIT